MTFLLLGNTIKLANIPPSSSVPTNPSNMADYAPPSGPPPPKVPEGWKAVWNSQYNEWFYVNIYTKQSQWDKPTEPTYAPPSDGAPPGPPPGYDHSSSMQTTEKSNNPYLSGQQNNSQLTSDEQLARQLQEE